MKSDIVSTMAEPSVTDWIQAAAALFAVIFGAITVWDIRKKSAEQDRNLQYMDRQVKIAEEQFRHAKERGEKEAMARRRSIRPEFKHLNTTPHNHEKKLFVDFQNIGKEGAFDVGVEYPAGNEVNLSPFFEKEILRGKLLRLYGRFEETHPAYAHYKIIIYFADQDGNRYRQIFTSAEAQHHITDPEPI